jgi:hypothetical protein
VHHYSQKASGWVADTISIHHPDITRQVTFNFKPLDIVPPYLQFPASSAKHSGLTRDPYSDIDPTSQ